MTQQDKKLLLKDLCARLPYGVIVHAGIDLISIVSEVNVAKDKLIIVRDNDEESKLSDVTINLLHTPIKMYLRSFSNMTSKGVSEFRFIWLESCRNHLNYSLVMDYLNEHMIDYRGLIEKGLALEAPERMYE